MRSVSLVALTLFVSLAAAAQTTHHADRHVAASNLRPAITAGSAVRSFVSSTGLDTNPCTRLSPCRSFGAAIAQTVSGGVVIAIDSAGYGAVVIGGSVTLVAPEGVYAALTATSGSAVAIAGTTTSDVVSFVV